MVYADRFSVPLINGNVCDMTLSMHVQPKNIPTHTIFVCRIKTLIAAGKKTENPFYLLFKNE